MLRRLVRRGGGGLHHVAYAVPMSGPHPGFCVSAVCGCFMMHQEPVPAARKSTLSTPRTLAAFFSSWSNTPGQIRTVPKTIGAERMAVAHAGKGSASIPIFGEGFLAVNASDNTGLGLFDDTASAVGNFPPLYAATTERRLTTTSAPSRRALSSPVDTPPSSSNK